MKQNFAGQPDGGGALGNAGPFPSLTGKDLMSDVSPNLSTIFRPYPRFVDNCKTKKCMKKSMKNFDDDYNYGNEDSETDERGGGFFSLGNLNLGDLFRTGTTVFTETQRNKAMQQQAALALQIEQQKAAQAKALAQQKAAESGSVAGKIKAYTTPIIVVGVLTIGGIAAYFYFKKKKIS
jgi:hypothetical protein